MHCLKFLIELLAALLIFSLSDKVAFTLRKYSSKSLFAAMQCDEECEHYEPCIPTCPTPTCDTLLEPQSPNCQEATCVEGCAKDVCPPGEVYKSATDKECVSEPDCDKKCLEIDGEVYMEGDKISEDECHTWLVLFSGLHIILFEYFVNI